MKKLQLKRARDERGVSLVEIMVAIVLLGTAVMSLASAAGLAMRTTVRGRQDMQMWAAVQWKADSLVSLGWGNVTNGSDTVHGYPMSWTVSGTNLERIDLLVDHASLTTGATIRDTLLLYLTN
ncbi:MAG: prepilin-type N-terminal cleavage/methylation domain-containing protein [Gemmatimonadetes bacterium]|nr:prepilin-type N-terminal cleavage/methylation domain-containing protein [Gemmatimonadota bacterium]